MAEVLLSDGEAMDGEQIPFNSTDRFHPLL